MNRAVRARRRIWVVAATATGLVIGVIGFFGWRLTPYVRDRAVKALSDRLEGEVELSTLRITWTPHLGVSGEGLAIRHRGRTDVPPLIELKSFSADATIPGLLARPMRLRTVHVSGLRIHIPPRGDSPGETVQQETDRGASKPDRADEHQTDLTIDHLLAEDAELHIMPKERDKLPRVFLIHRVQVESVGKQQQASFQAMLTNPKPRGEIQSTGTIGPWVRDEPSLTPVAGTYTFSRADLGTIRGIGGILDSTGKYGGPLERIEVEGETNTADFSISKVGTPVPLHTNFLAVVDGTNGDTILKRVDAKLRNSSMVATGAVIAVKGVDGHSIKINVVMDDGRIEDMLQLAMKSDRPVLTGSMDLKTDLEIPPGDVDVIDKLYLHGSFGLNRATFTKAEMQKKVEELSKRGRGKTEGTPDNVVSNLRGGFIMRHAVIRFTSVDFDVPGASVDLSGTYNLRSEEIDLKGTLTLQAKISETVTGFKSILLKAFDPLFQRKNAGAVIPINVTGTRKNPKFGLDTRHALTHGR